MDIQLKTYKPYFVCYHIGVRRRKQGILAPEGVFHIINNPKDGWCADPFLIEHNETTFLFAEKWNYKKQKGEIVYTTLKQPAQWETVIEEKYHLSYPNVFLHNGNYYMCAETSENNDIHLYRAISFPAVWQKDVVITEGKRFADTTFYHGSSDGCWGFSYGCEGVIKGKLFRFAVNEKYEQIDKIRVITHDARIARPAGKFVCCKDKVYRIAQDCSHSYGESISICEVEKCTKNEYKERLISQRRFSDITTDKPMNVIGMHTYNVSENWEVVDFRVKRFGIIDYFHWKKRLSRE